MKKKLETLETRIINIIRYDGCFSNNIVKYVRFLVEEKIISLLHLKQSKNIPSSNNFDTHGSIISI